LNIERITAFSVAGIALVLAMQLLLRSEQPTPAVVAPEIEQPARGSGPQRVPPRSAETEPAAARDAAATADEPRDPIVLAEESPPRPADDGSRRFVFDCGNGVTFAVRTAPSEATLFSPQALGAEVVTLPRASEIDSGTRYAEGEVSYSSQGGLATFEIRDRTFADCTSNPGAAQTAEARRRGATFRARGNEPSWQLEISGDRIELATDLGTRRVDFPYREPTVVGTRTTYSTFVGTQELVVVIERARCNDTMSGEAFEASVTVTFENDTLYGCGQTP